jgi:hypothetical protein
MKVQPKEAFKLLGTGIELDPTFVYNASPADNLPDITPGLIYVHERDENPVGVLLREGEYTIIKP